MLYRPYILVLVSQKLNVAITTNENERTKYHIPILKFSTHMKLYNFHVHISTSVPQISYNFSKHF
jgi:hypothetical protein